MGEEEKKTEEKKMEEKKPEEAKEEKKEEPKAEEKKVEEPPPPQEIVLRVYMHCEGCARKVRRCLKGFEGVEDVVTDYKTHKVVVKGEKADPVKVLERVQRKSHGQVELISPIPKPPEPEASPKAEEKAVPKVEEKKEEVVTVVLKVHMHCEACAQEIKKRMIRMNGVENVEPDLKSSQVTVKGAFDPPKLVDYVYKRTGKHALIVKQVPEKKEEEKGKEEKPPKEEKKLEDDVGGDKEAKKSEAAAKDGDAPAAVAVVVAEGEEETTHVLELKKNEFYSNNPQNYHIYAPPRYEMNAYAPQMFSDENPNACSVM